MKKGFIILSLVVSLCFYLIIQKNFDLRSQLEKSELSRKTTEIHSSNLELITAEKELAEFLNGKNQTFEACKEIVLHLEESSKNNFNQIRIREAAQKLIDFASSDENWRSNKTVMEINRNNYFYGRILDLQN